MAGSSTTLQINGKAVVGIKSGKISATTSITGSKVSFNFYSFLLLSLACGYKRLLEFCLRDYFFMIHIIHIKKKKTINKLVHTEKQQTTNENFIFCRKKKKISLTYILHYFPPLGFDIYSIT